MVINYSQIKLLWLLFQKWVTNIAFKETNQIIYNWLEV